MIIKRERNFMNTRKYLILKHGEDITSYVKFCAYNSASKKWDVIFQKNKTLARMC